VPRKKPAKAGVTAPPFPQGESTVSTVHGDGRAGNGRFAPGNTFAAGNTNHQRAHALRAALLAKATPERMERVIEKLLEDAAHEDPQVRLPSRKELLDRVIGKAQQFVHVTEEPDDRPDLSQLNDVEIEEQRIEAIDAVLESIIAMAPDKVQTMLQRVRKTLAEPPNDEQSRRG
jgi:hypothetical protein